jgi:hypothetical protein
MNLHIRGITVDCADPYLRATWWSEATGWLEDPHAPQPARRSGGPRRHFARRHQPGLHPGPRGENATNQEPFRALDEGGPAILFIFDPARNAVLLVAGDKAGQWTAGHRESVPLAEARHATYLKERRVMSSTHAYDRDGFLAEFFPDAADRAEVEAGAQAPINVSRATGWQRCASVSG